jgi:hypothetical protein
MEKSSWVRFLMQGNHSVCKVYAVAAKEAVEVIKASAIFPKCYNSKMLCIQGIPPFHDFSICDSVSGTYFVNSSPFHDFQKIFQKNYYRAHWLGNIY